MRWQIWVPFGALALAACGGSTEPQGGSGGSDAGVGGTGGSAGSIWDDCTLSSECVIRSASCCGSCGAATREDIIALNASKAGAYANSVCDGLGCATCYMATDPTLVATCAAGHCAVVDLLQSPVTKCSTPDDCRIRTNACCECGGAMDMDHIIAINVGAEADYSALVCDGGQGCPECAPVYPSAVSAVCESGACQALWVSF